MKTPLITHHQWAAIIKHRSGFERAYQQYDAALKRFGLTADLVRKWQDLMRPGRMSLKGFLGKNENLMDVLLQDERYLNKAGISSRTISDVLYRILFTDGMGHYPSTYHVLVNGKEYEVRKVSYHGSQSCFCDQNYIGHLGGKDVAVININTGEKLVFSDLLIHLIRDHCFFEGNESPYRLEPGKVIEFFNLMPGQEIKVMAIETPEYLFVLQSNRARISTAEEVHGEKFIQGNVWRDELEKINEKIRDGGLRLVPTALLNELRQLVKDLLGKEKDGCDVSREHDDVRICINEVEYGRINEINDRLEKALMKATGYKGHREDYKNDLEWWKVFHDFWNKTG